MIKEDEKLFMAAVLKTHYSSEEWNESIKHLPLMERIEMSSGIPTPREILQSMEVKCFMHHKRAWYLLEKWCNKDLYTFGVNLELGWLTKEGVKHFEEIVKCKT